MHDMTYREAMNKKEHLIALGSTTVYLRDDGDKPWGLAESVEAGSSYRLGGPNSCYIIAKNDGLTFKWNVEFEERDANGRGVYLFARDRLREVMRQLPLKGRRAFAEMLRGAVLEGMKSRTAELRAALNSQVDSEDCVRGLIEFSREIESKVA